MAAVLVRSGRSAEMARVPQAVVRLVGDVIEERKKAAMVKGIRYEKPGAAWTQTLFDEGFQRDLTRLMKGGAKSVYDEVPVDSQVERDFLAELVADNAVKLFAKLPKTFVIPTPLGNYEPDWAVLLEEDGQERLYFVVETKGTLFDAGLREKERQKIACGRRHFEALAEGRENPARYKVTRTLDDLRAAAGP